MTRDEVDALSDDILETLDGFSPDALRALASGLRMAEAPLHAFGPAVRYLADNRERGEPPDGLTLLSTSSALRRASFRPVPQLAGAEDPFWRAIADALEVMAEDTLTV